jgi:hypothetical protein
MLKCWDSDSKLRPRFGEIFGALDDILAQAPEQKRRNTITEANPIIFQEEIGSFYLDIPKDDPKYYLYNA